MKSAQVIAAAVALSLLLLAGCRTVPVDGQGAVEGDAAEQAQAVGPADLPVVRVAPSRPAPAAPLEHQYREVPVNGAYVALTFDDGPSARQTPRLLDILEARGIRATFFVVGQRAAAHPTILRRMAAEGHEIANHTWNHGRLPDLSHDAVRRQIHMTNEVIRAAVGEVPVLMRPPYGKTTPHLNRWLSEDQGLTVILWSVDSQDWKYRDPERVQREIVARTKPGAIILAHDIHPTTVAAMPATLDKLTAAGFQFVTVSELIALGRVQQLSSAHGEPVGAFIQPGE